ncbi:MAG TPA: TetR family transcriptional regulator [Stellaceae bacterium]|nr:TetR family transcriptional regulator [Stellaceae bacterium]
MTMLPARALAGVAPAVPVAGRRRPKRRYSMARRAAQAAATKERIREAAVALHTAQLFDFTLDEVGRRAGVTVQTVLRIYGSKDALYAVMMDAAANRPRRASPPGDIRAAVAALYDDYETIGDRVIQYLADELRHRAMTPKIDLGRKAHRQWVETVFAPQLQARRKSARHDLLRALVIATDVYAWKLLRRDAKLARRDAERVIVRMISDLI